MTSSHSLMFRAIAHNKAVLHLQALQVMRLWAIAEASGPELAQYASVIPLPAQEDPMELVNLAAIPSHWNLHEMTAAINGSPESSADPEQTFQSPCQDMASENLMESNCSSSDGQCQPNEDWWEVGDAWNSEGEGNSWFSDSSSGANTEVTDDAMAATRHSSPELPLICLDDIFGHDKLSTAVSGSQLIVLAEQLRKAEAVKRAMENNMDWLAKRADQRTGVWHSKATRTEDHRPCYQRCHRGRLDTVESAGLAGSSIRRAHKW